MTQHGPMLVRRAAGARLVAVEVPDDRPQRPDEVGRALGRDDAHLVGRYVYLVAGAPELRREQPDRHVRGLEHLEVVDLVVEDEVVHHVGIGREQPQRHPIVLLAAHLQELQVRVPRDLGPRLAGVRELPGHRQRRVDEVDPHSRLHVAPDLLGGGQEGVGHGHEQHHDRQDEEQLRQVVERPHDGAALQLVVDQMAGMMPRMAAAANHQAEQGEQDGRRDDEGEQEGQVHAPVAHLVQLGPGELLDAGPQKVDELGPFDQHRRPWPPPRAILADGRRSGRAPAGRRRPIATPRRPGCSCSAPRPECLPGRSCPRGRRTRTAARRFAARGTARSTDG